MVSHGATSFVPTPSAAGSRRKNPTTPPSASSRSFFRYSPGARQPTTAMNAFSTSFAPSPMVLIRASRIHRSIGWSQKYPFPPHTWSVSFTMVQRCSVANTFKMAVSSM